MVNLQPPETSTAQNANGSVQALKNSAEALKLVT